MVQLQQTRQLTIFPSNWHDYWLVTLGYSNTTLSISIFYELTLNGSRIPTLNFSTLCNFEVARYLNSKVVPRGLIPCGTEKKIWVWGLIKHEFFGQTMHTQTCNSPETMLDLSKHIWAFFSDPSQQFLQKIRTLWINFPRVWYPSLEQLSNLNISANSETI